MSDHGTNRRPSPFITGPVCMLLAAVFYFASFGPVTWLAAHDRISNRTHEHLCDTVYLPLRWIEFDTDWLDHPVGEAYVSYVEWWEAL